MSEIQSSDSIQDVKIAHLASFSDERGRFMETFRREWFPDTDWSKLQSNRSDSQAHVLRGLHYHFKQVDYWYVLHGRLRAGLVDLRPSSPTYLKTQMIDMGEENNIGLFIPIGVAHGFIAQTDCTLIYYVNNYYDSTDEFGVAWDDPALGLDWGVDRPILSERDRNNPRLDAIPDAVRPESSR